jgi:hypothetical protein
MEFLDSFPAQWLCCTWSSVEKTIRVFPERSRNMPVKSVWLKSLNREIAAFHTGCYRWKTQQVQHLSVS